VKVLIVEDEPGVAQNLCDLLLEVEPELEILAILESVEETIQWIAENPAPELGFFDIRLADGNSFEIFESVSVPFPVIFTTAFDEFALKAFKVNSIDYLLKPIDKKEIAAALAKYREFYRKDAGIDPQKLISVIESFRQSHSGRFKKTLLVYQGEKIIPLDIQSIAYLQLKDDLVYAVTHRNTRHHLDQSLERLQKQLNPSDFFRANRQFIVSRKSVTGASQHFNRKLILQLQPDPKTEVLISKSRVTEFKNWLAG
jgi:DNA-binding LytR/AlgR family response regulator